MENLSHYGQQTNSVDPFSNAVALAQHAEKRARKNKNVSDMLAASTQWLAIAQIHQELSQDEPEEKRVVGFIGGSK